MSNVWGYGPYGFNPYGNNCIGRPLVKQVIGTQTMEGRGGRRYTVTYYNDGSKKTEQNYATPWGYNN
jgi:hypothetical protein